MTDSANLKNYQRIDECYYETLKPLEFYKKTFVNGKIIPSKIKYINDFKSWIPVFVVLIVPTGTKVVLNIKKGKVKSCRSQQALVIEQFLLDGFNETSIITESKSFYDENFIYTNIVEVKDLIDNAGIYMYCDKIDAKCH